MTLCWGESCMTGINFTFSVELADLANTRLSAIGILGGSDEFSSTMLVDASDRGEGVNERKGAVLNAAWGWARSERPGLLALCSMGDMDVMLDGKLGSVLDRGVGSTVDEDEEPGTIGMALVDGDEGTTGTV